jgi:hypothetical protein
MPTTQRHKAYDDTEPCFAAGTPRATQRQMRRVEDDETLRVDPTVDFGDHELVDGGEVCVHCHEVIKPGEYVRRTSRGRWQHGACPRRHSSSS